MHMIYAYAHMQLIPTSDIMITILQYYDMNMLHAHDTCI